MPHNPSRHWSDWTARDFAELQAQGRAARAIAVLPIAGGGYTVAYVARAVTPGTYALPGASIEDMYKPGVGGRSATGRLRVAAR